MNLELVPTLESLRTVYGVPRGPARFQAYIDAAVGGAQAGAEVALPPLTLANPMSHGQAVACLERWIELGAEETAHAALDEAAARLPSVSSPSRVRAGLTLLDDVGGGWTNRFINDAARFELGSTLGKTGWLSLPLWASEEPDLAELRCTVLEWTFHALSGAQDPPTGEAPTLRDMLRRQGEAAAFAGRRVTFGTEELEYSRAVLAPHLDTAHQPTALACLYGDDGARAWGYAPLGLSGYAGFQVALADALGRQEEAR